jgi:multiple sugar transport system permease protein
MPSPKLNSNRHRTRQNLLGYLFVSPWLIGFLTFTAWPFLQSIYLSFTRYNIVTPAKWVGGANYKMLLTQDELFWKSAWVTVKYAAISVPLAIVAGVALALLLNVNVKGMTVFRTLFYLPSIVPTVATSVLFIWLLNPNIGLVNKLFGIVGIQGPAWLNTSPWAFYSLVFMALWGVGGSMVIYLAGLKDVPIPLYEAATIDGANAFSKMRHITLPMITPVIFFNLVMGIIGAFQTFTQAYVITPGGGPQDSTYFYSLYLYNRAWKYLDMGYASAMAWMLFLVIAVLTLVVFRTQKRWVHYGG